MAKIIDLHELLHFNFAIALGFNGVETVARKSIEFGQPEISFSSDHAWSANGFFFYGPGRKDWFSFADTLLFSPNENFDLAFNWHG